MGFSFYWSRRTVSQSAMRTLETKLKPFINTKNTKMVVKDGTLTLNGSKSSNSCETFVVEPNEKGFCFCKTGREAYTQDVAIALILMFEYGFMEEESEDGNPLSSDDNEYFRDALKVVQKATPLANYETLKKMFQDECEEDEEAEEDEKNEEDEEDEADTDPSPLPKDLVWDGGFGGVTNLPKGRYYVGDLCYFLKDEIYDKVWGDRYNYKPGCYHAVSASDPTKRFYFEIASTHGDGSFKDVYNNMEYGVDAGILGICSMELAKDYEDAVKAIAKTKNGKGVEYDGGSLWDFTGDVSTNFDEENEKYHICAGYSQEIYIKRGYDDEDEDDEDD